MKIYKYQLPVQENFILDIPEYAEILRVGDVGGMFFMWAKVDPEAPLSARKFCMYKTGQDIPNDNSLTYLGYCRLFVGQELCLYIFENHE